MFEPSACVLIPVNNSYHKILAVSRRNDFTQWGIPGGKQEPGESNLDCACREIKEECSVWLDKGKLQPIYSGACFGKDGRNFWVTTYLYLEPYSGDAAAEEGFMLMPMYIQTLCLEKYSPFFKYNIAAMEAWKAFQG